MSEEVEGDVEGEVWHRLDADDLAVIVPLAVLLALGFYAAVFHPEPFWAGFGSWLP